MLRGLGPRQVAAAHQLCHQRVVLCHGAQLAAAQEVSPRVPDVRDLSHRLPVRPPEADRHHRRPHPGEPLVAPAGGEYPAVRLPYRLLERGARLELAQDLDSYAARHLPGFETTDAVGDSEERLVLALADEQGVLVVAADLARIGYAERF